MRCPGCGLSYPGEPSCCPQCGTAASLGSEPRPEFLPLRGLGNVLIVLLAVVIAAIAARLALELPGLGSAHWACSFIDYRLDKAADMTIIGLGILFVVWFRRARINAGHRGWRQRRARGWTFWGWIIPVVSLWIPFQIMGDIWRAGRPAPKRRDIAWLPALWWTTWLLSGVTAGTGARSADYPWPHLAPDTWTGSLYFLAASGVTLIAIIRVVSTGPIGSPHPCPPAALPATLPE
jgi:hypothetical protein